MSVLASKLSELGGIGKLAAREFEIRNRLGWHTKPRSVIRHLIYGERLATVEETNEIEAAHALWSAEQIGIHRREDAALIDSIIRFVEQAQKTDPEFYRPHLEALRDTLLQSGCRLADLEKPD